MNEKIKWLREKLSTLDLDGMIVSNPVNIKYLTGIDAEGVLLITRKENIYITDARYTEHINSILTIDDEISLYDYKDIDPIDYENLFMFCSNVGFEENYVTYAKYKEYKQVYKINNLVETDNFIETQRMIKAPDEINNIQKACKITDACFNHICNFIKVGMTEKEIAFEIEHYFRTHGADGIAFDTIVASGSNSSMPHAIPTDRKIEAGDPITIDFGCKYKGYCSDMTRTIFVEYVPEGIKPIYNLVLKNQQLTLDAIQENANARILTMMVESDFKVNGYMLDHSLGHGVGLDIHEKPFIGKKDFLLKENMIVTDEPGIYLPGKFGVRIEDTVLVTKNGCIRLTESDKNYIIVNN